MADRTLAFLIAAVLGAGAVYLFARPAPAAPGPVTPRAAPQFVDVEYTVGGCSGCK